MYDSNRTFHSESKTPMVILTESCYASRPFLSFWQSKKTRVTVCGRGWLIILFFLSVEPNCECHGMCLRSESALSVTKARRWGGGPTAIVCLDLLCCPVIHFKWSSHMPANSRGMLFFCCQRSKKNFLGTISNKFSLYLFIHYFQNFPQIP